MVQTKTAYQIVIEGRVQGVGFRYFAKQKAMEINVFGWIKNNANGNVQIEVEGEKEAIDNFISNCFQGPPMAMVTHVHLSEIPTQGFRKFEIR